MEDDFFLTNLELRESTDTGEEREGLSHRTMTGMFLLQVRELAARGEPQGAVTVVHDAGDHGGRYQGFAGALAEGQWAVALPDLRGHGGTEGDRGHSGGINEVVRDLAAIQDHLAYRLPDSPKVLVGQGLGALYSLAFAVEKPGQLGALVLIAPLHAPAFDLPVAPSGLKKFFKKVGPRSAGQIGYTPEQLFSDPAALSSWTGDALVHDSITLRAGEQAIDAAARYWPRLATLGLPTLIVHGDQDPISDVATSRALAGDSVTVEVIEGARHQPLNDGGSEQVRERILEWLAANVRSGF
ncbi:MAG: acylglycerol lipase [Chlamydiales bacterium]|jgi:acylglycerol lipase